MTDIILMICIAVFFVVFGAVFFWADNKAQQELHCFFLRDHYTDIADKQIEENKRRS